ncbi:MAG TPA: sulfite exporter TauE/SafE family protein [Verrucomicrobiae bacterium]|nr:sulfite exporter TauE/SafE family protein [Verrucomicrobiae bacterium]
MHWELILIGLGVGTIVGLTGVGGAAIMTPLLVLALKVNPLIAVGSDLLYSVPTKLYGAYLHNRQRTVNWEIVKALLWGGIPAALVGVLALYWMRSHLDVLLITHWTRRAIGYALFLAAAIMLVRPFIKRRETRVQERFAWSGAQRGRVIAIGALVGLIVTATSIGSGSVTLPLLSLALPMVGLQELVGSDIAFAAFLIPTAAAGRWSMGDVNLGLVLNLLVGSLPGVYIGSKLCGKLEQRYLRPVVAVTLVVVGTRMI